MNFYIDNSLEEVDGIPFHELGSGPDAKRPRLFNFNSEQIKKPDRFSNLSAEERYIFIKKINALQKLINEIQSSKEREMPESGFSLEEVLEVLNVRRAMQNYRHSLRQ